MGFDASKGADDSLHFSLPNETGDCGDGGKCKSGDAQPRSDKRQKVLLETEKLAILVSSYNYHFSEYCRARLNVTQRVPSKNGRMFTRTLLRRRMRSRRNVTKSLAKPVYLSKGHSKIALDTFLKIMVLVILVKIAQKE